MKFGVHISQAVGFKPAGADYIGIAQHAEGLGFDSVWLGDHVVIPKAITAKYPYTKDGSIGFPPTTPWPDTFAIFSAMAASTKKIRFGTGILVVPYRNPVDVAKSVATVDLISNGRFSLGVGIGWLQEEFQTLGIPFNERGPRTDEYLRIMKAMWTGGNTTHKGRFFSVPDLHVNPLTVQKPHPPILVGGQGEPAFKRIAALGDGWLCGHIPVDALRPQIDQLSNIMAEKGRKMSELTLAMISDPEVARDKKGVAALAGAGISEMVIYLRDLDIDQCRRELDSLAKAAIAK